MKDPQAFPGPQHDDARAGKPGVNPQRGPEPEKGGLRPVHMGVLLAGVAAAVALFWFVPFSPATKPAPSAPSSASAAVAVPAKTWHGPEFKRFEVPTDKVQVRQVGEGFEIINTDPALTGQEITVKGETTDGGTITYTLKIPPPVGEGEGTAQ